MLLCAAAPHKALSGPVDFASSARGSNRPRCRILLGRLTEQNLASGVQDWLVLRMPVASPIANPGRDPECQNSCLLLRYFLPACPLL
jgi:hypothetical protein